VEELFDQVAAFAYQAKNRERPRFTMAEWKQKTGFRQAMQKVLASPNSSMIVKNFTKLQAAYTKKDKATKQLCLDWSGLGLSHTQLELLLPHIPPKVKYLNVSYNRLARIPDGLVPMIVQFKTIDVRGNLLQSLPTEMQVLDMLKWKDNPLTLVPENIRKQHNYWQQMRSYLGSLSNRAMCWKEVKLLLVGQEGVGKTTLLKSLMSPKGKTDTSANLSTDGVHIERGVTFDAKSNVEFNVWDLGGQEIFYPTHQFFLTSNSVYVLVFDMTNADQGRVEYWMRQIRTLSGNNRKSPIFIVATHCDDPSLSEEAILHKLNDVGQNFPKYRYAGLQCIVPVSCKTGMGIEQLKEKLVEVASQDWFRPRVAQSWVGLHDHIRVQREHMQLEKVEWKTYCQWASESGVPDSEVMTCTSFLTNVGSIIFYTEAGGTADSASAPEPAVDDLVVLNPQWLADLMACLITFRHSWIKDGKLRITDLSSHIFAAKYPTSIHEQLVALLERFAVIYITSSLDLAGYVIVPSMLPERPEGEKLELFQRTWPSVAPKGEVEYGREYTFPFLPLGFFEKIMVRVMHSQQVEPVLFWRTGIVARLGNQTACLLFDQRNVRFSLRVREPLRREMQAGSGEQRRQLLLREIVDSVETVIECFYRMEADVGRMLPCSHCLAKKEVGHGVGAGASFVEKALQGEVKMFPFKQCVEAMTESSTLTCGADVVSVSLLAPDLAFSDIPIIASKDLELGRKLGEGGFGAVYLGALGPSKTKVAVKELLASKDQDTDLQFSNFAQEVYIMSCLDHANLVKLYGISKEPRLRMVLELVPCGDLFDFLHPKDPSDPSGDSRFTIAREKFPWPLRMKIILDMARGMRYLQTFSPPIVHRDLRTPNIFLSSLNHEDPVCAKVADFGLSRMVAGNLAGALGTWQWLAPEVINATDDSKYDERSDTYSFGICCWEVATRQFPYDEFSTDSRFTSGGGREIDTLKIKKAISKGLRPSFLGPEEGCPPELALLIQQCWETDPRKRPDFDYILKKLYLITGLPMPELERQELADVPTVFQPSFSSRSARSIPKGTAGKRRESASWKTGDSDKLAKLGITQQDMDDLLAKQLGDDDDGKKKKKGFFSKKSRPARPLGDSKTMPTSGQHRPPPHAASTTAVLEHQGPPPAYEEAARPYSSSTALPSAAAAPFSPHASAPAHYSPATAAAAPPPHSPGSQAAVPGLAVPSYRTTASAGKPKSPRQESALGDAAQIVTVNASAAIDHVSTKFKSSTARFFKKRTKKE